MSNLFNLDQTFRPSILDRKQKFATWRQHPTRHQLYGHLPPITKTIQFRRTRHAGHCWRSRDELIRDVLLWTPTHGRAKVGRPPRTYIQQLCEDTGCCPEDLPWEMNDRKEWRERVRDIRATSALWWWWWWWYIYISFFLVNLTMFYGFQNTSNYFLPKTMDVWFNVAWKCSRLSFLDTFKHYWTFLIVMLWIRIKSYAII